MNFHSQRYRSIRKILRTLGITRLIGKVLKNNQYEQKFDAALEAAITSDSVVWDLGANHGIYTDKFHKKIGEKGKIVAFEPNHGLHEALRQRYKDSPNVEVVGVAVSNFTGETNFSTGNDALAATSKIGDASNNSYKVKVEDIKDLISRIARPDVAKVDVEGAEAEILNRVASNLSLFENVKFFVEVHFGIIDESHDSDLFFNDIAAIESSSREFTWIDPSHLYFRL